MGVCMGGVYIALFFKSQINVDIILIMSELLSSVSQENSLNISGKEIESLYGSH